MCCPSCGARPVPIVQSVFSLSNGHKNKLMKNRDIEGTNKESARREVRQLPVGLVGVKPTGEARCISVGPSVVLLVASLLCGIHRRRHQVAGYTDVVLEAIGGVVRLDRDDAVALEVDESSQLHTPRVKTRSVVTQLAL